MSAEPTKKTLAAAAEARGIAIPAREAPLVLAGAQWLRRCVELLRRSDLGK